MPEHEVEIIGPDGVPVGVVRRRPPPPSRPWLHAGLFLFTFVTVTAAGGLYYNQVPAEEARSLAAFLVHPGFITRGLMFSVPLLFILVCHEFGHYLACRAHRLDATLPFFIPAPPIFPAGTFGAFIRIKSPLTNKRELFDVGAAGPLAGFVATIPVLIVGIALAQPATVPLSELPSSEGLILYGEPLAFKLVSRALHPEVAAGADLWMHPTAFAAWIGLLVTAINLLPFGQLDGGHISYALFGRLQRRYSWPLLLVLFALGFVWMGWWLWAVIALVMGVRHPWLPDEDEPLDRTRMMLGWLCIAVFALAFTPQPVTIPGP